MVDASDGPQDRYRAPALDKGLDILELMAATEGGLTQAEIARQLGRSPNEFYRMLDRLVRRGYVERTDGDRYQLTLRLFALSHLHAPVRRMVSVATPLMRAFASEARQSIHLAVYDRAGVVVIAQIEAPGYWGMSIRVGARIGLFTTGSGHVLLAFASPAERAMMLGEYEPGTDEAPRLDDLDQLLDDIIRRGHASEPSMQTVNVHNLSVPILGPDGHAIAALTCPYLLQLGAGAGPDIAATLDLLRDKADRMSASMGSRRLP